MKTQNRNIQAGDITEALGLLSRLPVSATGDRGVRAAWAWPVAGAIIGGLAGIAAMVAIWLGLPTPIAAGIALVVQIMLTGAMHEDGLADCADGFWGGNDPHRRLEIMKDSAIGSYGTLALILSLLLRWSLLSALFSAGTILAPLVTAASLSRVAMAGLMFGLEPVRQQGLSDRTGRPTQDILILTCTTGALIAFVTSGFTTIPTALIAGGLMGVIGWVARNKIGGQTGDVLGAGQQVTEIGILMALVSIAG